MHDSKRERKIFFEKYLLGLTSREETEYLDNLVAEDPAMAAELAEVQEQLSLYLDDQGIVKAPFDRISRGIQDFEDLDHEMIMEMTRRNHGLIIWRYALGAVALLLVLLAGYLFSANQSLRAGANRLAAETAQDNASLQRKVDHLTEIALELDSLHGLSYPLDSGVLRLHYIPDNDLVFVDLIGAPALGVDSAYFLFVGDDAATGPVLRVTAEQQDKLHPIHADEHQVRLWRWGVDHEFRDTSLRGPVVAELVLPETIRAR